MEPEDKFIPIKLNVLRIGTLKPFDIYLKTDRAADHYVLYSRKGSYFTNKIRQNLLLNKVEIIYTPDKNRDLYQQYVEDNLPNIIKDKHVAPEQKSKIVYESGTYLMQKLFEEPRAEVISRTKKPLIL